MSRLTFDAEAELLKRYAVGNADTVKVFQK